MQQFLPYWITGEMARLLYNPNAHYHVHKSPQTVINEINNTFIKIFMFSSSSR
jgi:hypothetical protein